MIEELEGEIAELEAMPESDFRRGYIYGLKVCIQIIQRREAENGE